MFRRFVGAQSAYEAIGNILKNTGGYVEIHRIISTQDEIQRYWWVVPASQIDIHADQKSI